MSTTRKSERAKEKSLELESKDMEVAQLYSDLRESFESLCEVNKKLRAANEKLEKQNKAQREFINVAAHELRTPTQSVVGYCEMLEMFPERTKDYLKRLKRNADRLWTLTSDLLDATMIDTGMLRLNNIDFNLIEMINEVAHDMRKKFYVANKNADIHRIIPDIELSISSNPIMVHADKNRIVQVLSNLLDNAIKFTPSGTIIISTKRDDNLVIVNVKDTGKGIDPEIHPKLFQRFITNSDSGTGLGLFISKSIIEAQSGSIWAQNNKDGGATFSFTLPIVKKILK
jgi:two-component system, OmpR family, sensor histidine kinase VicK